MIAALFCTSLCAAVVLVSVMGRTRYWWLPGSAALAGGVSFLVDLARQPKCHDGALCGLDAIGNAILGIVGIGLVVVGWIVLGVAFAVRRDYLARRAAELAVPVARVVR
jgi:hypothetical protein